MMRHILLLEQNKDIADLFQETLSATGSGTISLVGSMREACQIVTQEPFEAAIIPLTYAGRQASVLESLRPGLAIIYSSSTNTPESLQNALDSTYRVVHLARLETELPAAMAALNLSGQESYESTISERSEDLSSRAGLALLKNLIRTADLGKKVRQIVLSYGGELIAFGGYQSKMQAQRIASQINKTWAGEEESVQVQFIQIADVAEPILLYTRLAAGLLLTLAAVPDISISAVRGRADQLAARIMGDDYKVTADGLSSSQPSQEIEKTGNGSHGYSYAIAWRPRKTLPSEIKTMIRQSIRQAAQENDCVISHLAVENDFIQLVVACPPGRDGAWAAELFKDKTEADIFAQYGVHATLWQAGYYAKASHQPYSEAELTIFAKQFLQG